MHRCEIRSETEDKAIGNQAPGKSSATICSGIVRSNDHAKEYRHKMLAKVAFVNERLKPPAQKKKRAALGPPFRLARSLRVEFVQPSMM
jgi:hypothetical protein